MKKMPVLSGSPALFTKTELYFCKIIIRMEGLTYGQMDGQNDKYYIPGLCCFYDKGGKALGQLQYGDKYVTDPEL